MGVLFVKPEKFSYGAELARNRAEYSVEVKADASHGKDMGAPRRHPNFANRELASRPFEDDERTATVWGAFCHGHDVAPDAKCLGTRVHSGDGKRGKYVYESFADVKKTALEFSAGLAEMGVREGDSVGICSANRAEWTTAALGNYARGFVNVALYDTLGADAVEFILDHSEAKVALVSKEKLPLVLGVLDKVKSLKTIVQFDANPLYKNEADKVDEKDAATARDGGVRLVGFQEVREMGAKAAADEAKDPSPKPEATGFIMYTSGTTGKPKGVVLTNGSIMACIAGSFLTHEKVKILPSDRFLSYLPLAHIFETVAQVGMLMYGACVAFFQGNIKLLANDILDIEPTIFAGVPRVYTRFHDKVMNGVKAAGGIKAKVVLGKFEQQARNVRRGQPQSPSLRKFFRGKVAPKMGLHKCRLMITGAAPMPPHVMEFLRVVISPEMGVLEGYGMTETSAAVTITAPDDHCLGHVGGPMGSAEICLRDVPEMGYLHTNDPPTGEICARGPSICKGYFKNPEATAGLVTEDGWLGTGDIGRWNPNGTLSIIDRKKNIFKLANGEYIAAEKCEATFKRFDLVGQIFVYGNSFKSFLVAVVVPEGEQTTALAKEKGWWPADAANAPLMSRAWIKAFKTVVDTHRKELTDIIIAGMKQRAEADKLNRAEMPRAVILEGEVDDLMQGFNVNNDCMTPTFKLRRPFLLRRYYDQIVQAYADNGEPKKDGENWMVVKVAAKPQKSAAEEKSDEPEPEKEPEKEPEPEPETEAAAEEEAEAPAAEEEAEAEAPAAEEEEA